LVPIWFRAFNDEIVIEQTALILHGSFTSFGPHAVTTNNHLGRNAHLPLAFYHSSGIFVGIFLQAPTTSNSTNRELPPTRSDIRTITREHIAPVVVTAFEFKLPPAKS